MPRIPFQRPKKVEWEILSDRYPGGSNVSSGSRTGLKPQILGHRSPTGSCRPKRRHGHSCPYRARRTSWLLAQNVVNSGIEHLVAARTNTSNRGPDAYVRPFVVQ